MADGVCNNCGGEGTVPVPVRVACCLLEGGRHAGEAEDGVHLRVHRHGLTALS